MVSPVSRVVMSALLVVVALSGCTETPMMTGTGGGGGGGEVVMTPTAALSATTVDFANVGCGVAATSKELTLTNSGTGALTYSVLVTGTGFALTSMSSGTVAAGSSAKVTVTATVAATASAGADQTGTLTLTTNDTAHASFAVPLHLKTSGVTLTLTPTVASFGVLPVNTQAPALPLTLTNTGSVAATITFTQPGDGQFSLTWAGSPAAASVAPGGSVSMLAAGFRPAGILASSTTADITVVEPVCGGVTSISMTGQGTNGVVGFSSTELFFGNNGKVNCGATAPAKTFTITNSGNQAFSWIGTLTRGSSSPFSFSPTSGTVPANGGSVMVTVTSSGIPSVASTAVDAFGDTLAIVTDVANDTSHLLSLHQTANGAALSFAPGAIDFGMVPINTTANAPLSIVNSGSAEANVTLSSDNTKFSLVPAGPTLVAAGTSGAVTTTFAPGASVLPQAGNVTLTVDAADVLCAPLPSMATLSGTGTNGSVSFSPVALDFGQVNCGSTAAAKTVTFRNDGNQAYTITPALSLGASSSFALSMFPDSGVVVQDGGTVILTVTPRAIPQNSAVTPNLYGDTLTVTTDVPADTAHDVPLRETARGSIFAISATSLNFGSVAAGANAGSQFTVSNSGNAAGALTFTTGQPTIFQMPMNASVAGGTSSGLTGNFTPIGAMSYSDTANITVGANTVLCQPLPFTSIALTGVGTSGNVVAVSASSLTFGSGGFVACGTQASAQQVTVTNNSSQTLTLALTLAGGASSPYTVTGPTSVAAGASVMVTVTPKLIPATSSVAPDGFADSLSILATGGVVNETHVVALHETAQGAILSFNPTALSFNASGAKNFTVNNTGNLAAPYTLALGGTNAGDWVLSPTSGNAAGGGSVSSTATFSRPLLGGSRSGTVSLSSNVVRCAPLPSPLTLSGN